MRFSPVLFYSCLKASTGVRREALHAGIIPARAPIAVAIRIAPKMSSGVSAGVITIVEA